jgi:hypothetical protein
MSELPPDINKEVLLSEPPLPTEDPERLNIATSKFREGLNAIALIIDNQVVEIMNVQQRTAAILLSDPTVVDLTDYIKPNGKLDVVVGMTYNESNGKFK